MIATESPQATYEALAADHADLEAFARDWLRQPGFTAMCEDQPDYVERERARAVAAGWWPRMERAA